MPKPYIPNDEWSRKAAEEGYRARSVYKLIELDERFHLLEPGQLVVDLGAAPGSWLQYAGKAVGPKGLVLGFDTKEIEPVGANVKTFVADITDASAINAIVKKEAMREADVVMSDAMPNTSGIKDVDQWRSVEIAQAAFAIADAILKPDGHCIAKVFRGADFDEFFGQIRHKWFDVEFVKADASRDRSREVYMIARKGNFQYKREGL